MTARAHRRGGAGPPLVYLPGIDASGELLLGTAQRLEEHFDLLRVRYDTTGPTPKGGDRYEDLAACVIRLFDDEGLEQPLVLAESFGVSLALQVALQAPGRVRALCLVNGFAHFPRRARLALSCLVMPWVPAGLFDFGRRTFSPLTLLGPRRTRELVAAFRAAPLRPYGSGYARRLAMIRGVDLRPRLAEITCPVDVYAADRDQVVPSVSAGEELAYGIAGARLHVIPRAGHVVLPLPEEPWAERLQTLAERSVRP